MWTKVPLKIGVSKRERLLKRKDPKNLKLQCGETYKLHMFAFGLSSMTYMLKDSDSSDAGGMTMTMNTNRLPICANRAPEWT